MSVWLLQQCYTQIITPVTELINQSFETGIYPEILKPAKVIPIYKKGDRSEMTNYRPISLLPVIGKIIEKLYFNRLVSFLDQFKIISNNQFGFRKGKCTTDAMNKLIEFVVKSLDNKQKIISVFLDLTKAFDCVSHKILLQIVHNFGIRCLPLQWLETYLCNRTQQVQNDYVISNSVNLKCGVPQGSCLGPILFILYVNQLNDFVKDCDLIQFADDTTLSYFAKTIRELEDKCSHELTIITEYFNDLNLKTNVTKSNFISFDLNRREITHKPTVTVGQNTLNEVSCVKYLGIHIDKKLSWDYHVEFVCKKLSSGIFLLRHLSKHCPQNILRVAYYGILFPHISYGVCLWGNCADTKLLRIFILQKAAIRIMAKIGYRDSCRDAFRELDILTLPSLYIFETILFCKLKCPLVQGKDIHPYNTKYCNEFRTDHYRLEAFSRLPTVAGIKFINKIPESIKSISNIKLFKKEIRKYLVSHAFYSVEEFMNHSLAT